MSSSLNLYHVVLEEIIKKKRGSGSPPTNKREPSSVQKLVQKAKVTFLLASVIFTREHYRPARGPSFFYDITLYDVNQCVSWIYEQE